MPDQLHGRFQEKTAVAESRLGCSGIERAFGHDTDPGRNHSKLFNVALKHLEQLTHFTATCVRIGGVFQTLMGVLTDQHLGK